MSTSGTSTSLLCALALSAAACQSAPPPVPPASANAMAVVNGREITRDDVEKAYRRTAQALQQVSDDEATAAKLALLNEMIVQEILVAKAGTLKVEVPDSELDAAFAEAKKNVGDDAFQKELTQRNLTAADMREGLKRELLTQKVIEREVLSKINVTDQDVTDFFNANKAQFNRAEESYHIAQIVITPVREQAQTNRTGDDADTPQKAATKAQMLMERLKGGAAFSQLAADYSEDPQSAQRGGDLGFVPISALQQAPPPLRDAVLQSTPGTVKVVSQGGAFTLVLLVAKEPAGQRDLSTPEVKEGILATLRGRKEQLLRGAYLSSIRNDVTVDNILARRVLETQGKLPTLAPTAPASRQ